MAAILEFRDGDKIAVSIGGWPHFHEKGLMLCFMFLCESILKLHT